MFQGIIQESNIARTKLGKFKLADEKLLIHDNQD